jgi:ribosome-associated protein
MTLIKNDEQPSRVAPADLLPEIKFTTSRSSGPGGQNVNKVNSKVTLRFSIAGSQVLTSEQKAFLLDKFKGKVTTDGELIISSQEKRSQPENKAAVIAKFEKLLTKVFERKKLRKKTKPSKAALEKRINTKKKQSEKKKWRQKF